MFRSKLMGIAISASIAIAALMASGPASAFTFQNSVSPGLLTTAILSDCGDYWSPSGVVRTVDPATMWAYGSRAAGYPQTVSEYATVYYRPANSTTWSHLNLPTVSQYILSPSVNVILQPGRAYGFAASTFATVVATFVWRGPNGAEVGRTSVQYSQTADYSADPQFTNTIVATVNSGTLAGCWFRS